MMQAWFQDARFGVFVHWGIYSAGDTNESWDMFNGVVSREVYQGQAAGFDAAHYDPEAWADLFLAAGARYVVFTTKHHDGFALWDTAQSTWNAAQAAPARRDLVGPLVSALRQRKIAVGLYFSHSDWAHPDYPSVTPPGKAGLAVHQQMRSNALAYCQGAPDELAWQRYLSFHRAQLRELCERFKPDLLWFDGDWERSNAQWNFEQLARQLQTWAPGVVVNGRMGALGDYATPEQALPVLAPEGPWEYCVTLNDSWGFSKKDQNFKSSRQCLELLLECAGMGGNLLLDIGPRADGSLVPEQVAVLLALGQWLKRCGEAVYATQAGLPHGHFWGPSTRSASGRTLYLFCIGRPDPQVSVRGLKNTVLRASVVGQDPTPLQHRVIGGAPWAGLPGILWVDVPAPLQDAEVTVIRLELDSPVDLYRGSGDKIIHNA